MIEKIEFESQGTVNEQAGALQDLWEFYVAESEHQLRRITQARAEFNKIPNAQHSARGYQVRSRLAVMYRQLEELRETERILRGYYRFSGELLRESRASAALHCGAAQRGFVQLPEPFGHTPAQGRSCVAD
ncbi:MAG: hypothetical protein LBT21_06085 [Oscillospiraceae bacterium]|jgi:hypothetical protein|nr:hypothetical protein [Oscillospiraceae bacterium]